MARSSGILEAAWQLLSERAYAGWTLADLAHRAGVSRRTLYLHFSSKEEIAAETVARNMARTAEHIRTMEPGAAPLIRLKSVLRWFVARDSDPNAIPVEPIKAEPGLMATVRTFPSYLAAYALLVEALAEVIEAAQRAGSLTPQPSPSTLAKLLLQLLRGVDPSHWHESVPMADVLLDVLLKGLGGRQ